MMDLEELGLVRQPHTSAGRVPTPLGYRVYVNDLLSSSDTGDAERKRLTALLRAQLRDRDAEAIIAGIAQSLANLSDLLGIAFLPTFDQAVFHKLELVPLDAGRVLVVISLKSGLVRTVKVAVDEPVNHDMFYEISQALN
jgi:heat-inducible transcriptional repressor